MPASKEEFGHRLPRTKNAEDLTQTQKQRIKTKEFKKIEIWTQVHG